MIVALAVFLGVLGALVFLAWCACMDATDREDAAYLAMEKHAHEMGYASVVDMLEGEARK